jgi:aminobenzoyl-glutamate utilization protein A
VREEAIRIIEGAAAMYGVSVTMQEMGGAAGCDNDEELVDRLRQYAKQSQIFPELVDAGNIGGSEDCTYFMERVQQRGGKAAYMMIGTEIAAGHHDFLFDFNEDVMTKAAQYISGAAAELLTNS